MKRILSLVLVAILSICVFVACGEEKGDTAKNGSGQNNTEEKVSAYVITKGHIYDNDYYVFEYNEDGSIHRWVILNDGCYEDENVTYEYGEKGFCSLQGYSDAGNPGQFETSVVFSERIGGSQEASVYLWNEEIATVSYKYDDEGRIIKSSSYDIEYSKESSYTQYSYDEEGRLSKMEDYEYSSKNNTCVLDEIMTYSYDESGRLNCIYTSDGSQYVVEYEQNNVAVISGERYMNAFEYKEIKVDPEYFVEVQNQQITLFSGRGILFE